MKFLTLITLALAGSPNEGKVAVQSIPPPPMTNLAAVALIGEIRSTLLPTLNGPKLIALIRRMEATQSVSAESLIKLVTLASSR